MASKTQLSSLISAIYAGSNYTANQLRGLLTSFLDTLFNTFYSSSVNPGTLQNQSNNFRAGNIGKNSSTDRYFVCTAATDTAATWERITLDSGYQSVSATSGATITVLPRTAFLNYTGSQNNVEVILPSDANSYEGKTIKVYFGNPSQNTGSGVFFKRPASPTPITVEGGIYRAGSVVELLYTGSFWTLLQSVLNTPDYGFETINASTAASPYQTAGTTANSRIGSAFGSTIASYTIILPQNPYTGKTVRYFSSTVGSIGTITSLVFQDQLGNTIATIASFSTSTTVDFVYTGSWLRVF